MVTFGYPWSNDCLSLLIHAQFLKLSGRPVWAYKLKPIFFNKIKNYLEIVQVNYDPFFNKKKNRILFYFFRSTTFAINSTGFCLNKVFCFFAPTTKNISCPFLLSTPGFLALQVDLSSRLPQKEINGRGGLQ